MKPGQSVASPRSITVAPSGTDSPAPTALMVLPSTITIAFGDQGVGLAVEQTGGLEHDRLRRRGWLGDAEGVTGKRKKG